MSVVIGIDPSLTVSGCARLDLGVGASDQVEAVRFEPWRARDRSQTEQHGYDVVTLRRRIRMMLREILALVPDRFDLAVVEGPSMRSKFTPLADERSGLRWMLIDQLLARGPVVLVPPTSRAMFATGAGNANKQDVLAAVRAMRPDWLIADHNIADATALAIAGAHALGMPWPHPMTEKQSLAHGKLPWPKDLAVA